MNMRKKCINLRQHYLSFIVLLRKRASVKVLPKVCNYLSISQGHIARLSIISNLSVKSSCKSFVKLLSPIGGSDRHISCSKSYSHAIVGDGLMLLGKLFWEIFRLVARVRLLQEIFCPMLL